LLRSVHRAELGYTVAVPSEYRLFLPTSPLVATLNALVLVLLTTLAGSWHAAGAVFPGFVETACAAGL